MADLIITPANVLVISGTPIESSAGVDISAGESVYLDTGNLWQLGIATASYSSYGIAVNSAATGQPLNVLTTGTIDLGVAVTQAIQYALSGLASGGIGPISDLIATQYQNILGYANGSNQLVIARYRIPFALT